VKGKYVEFEVGSATFGIRNYTLTVCPTRSTSPAGGGPRSSPARPPITGASR